MTTTSIISVFAFVFFFGQDKSVKYDIIQPTSSEYLIIKENVSASEVNNKNYREKTYKDNLLKEIRLYNIHGELSCFGYDCAIIRFKYYDDRQIKQISLFNELDEPTTEYVREFSIINFLYDGEYVKRIEYLNKNRELIKGYNDFPSIVEYHETNDGFLKKSFDEYNNLLSEKKIEKLPCIPYLTCERMKI